MGVLHSVLGGRRLDELLAASSRAEADRLALWRSVGRGEKKASRRKRLVEVIASLSKREHKMSYAELMDEELEVGSCAVEGAVKNIIGRRCDQGGMRWIRERAEAVAQLRSMELDGAWDRFADHVHDHVRQQNIGHGARVRIQKDEPAPLPEIEEAA